MAGTATAPPVNGTPTTVEVSLHWVDDNNKRYSDNILVDPATVDADIEAYAQAAQAGSNASLWQVSINTQYSGVALASQADSAVHESVADKVRLQTKQLSSGAYNPAYIPAPVEILVAENNEVDISQVLYTTWRDAVQAILPTGFALLNVGFTQNTQRNDSVNPV